MRRSVLALGASVTLIGLALAMPLPQETKQDPKNPQPAPPAAGQAEPKKPEGEAAPAPGLQDRVQLPGVLDSWYQIVQEKKQVGYAHEVIQRSGTGLSRYDYAGEAQISIEVPDPRDPEKRIFANEFVSIKGKLDDTLAPTDIQYSLNREGIEASVQVFATESGRQVALNLPDGSRKQFPVGTDEEVHATWGLMFIAMRQNDQLSKPGLRRGKIIYVRESEVPVTEISFDVVENVQREYMGKKTAVTKISWIKPPPAPTREFEILETYIDKFGRRVEEIYRGGLKVVLVEGEEQALKGLAIIPHGGRRDPFDKRKAMVARPQDDKSKTDTKDDIQVDVNNLAAGIAAAQKLIQELGSAVQEGQNELAEKAYQKVLAYYMKLHPLVLRNAPNLRPQVEALKQQAEQHWRGAEKKLAQARRIYVAAVGDMEREACADMEKKLIELRKFEAAREFFGADEQLAELRKMILDLEPMIAKCKTRLELARKKLSVTGTTSYYVEKPQKVKVGMSVFGHDLGGDHEVRFIQATHMAVINGKPYKQGDIVEGEGVRVEKIWTHGVQVSLREETRDVPLRQ